MANRYRGANDEMRNALARVAPGTTSAGVAGVSADPVSGDVYALRGEHFASVQGHLESILSRDGIRTLERLVSHALA